jgi:2-polyprenyl-6-methoxyphenol hydroxylase-like FAD-dependent oxidoreductase
LISLLTAGAVLGADLIDAVQGTPMAIEDAVQLASSLLHHNGISDEALSHYETVRKERVIPIWQESTRTAVAYYKLRDAEQNPMKVELDERDQQVFDMIQAYKPPLLKV